jgi:hypothetical protein
MATGPFDTSDENNFKPEAKERVIAWLRKFPGPAEEKRFIYARWARQAGVTVTTDDVQRFTSDANS